MRERVIDRKIKKEKEKKRGRIAHKERVCV